MPFDSGPIELDLEAATAASVRICRSVVITPNAFEKMLQTLCGPSAGVPGGVHTPVVVLDYECAWKIVSFYRQCCRIDFALFFPSVANEAPNLQIGFLLLE